MKPIRAMVMATPSSWVAAAKSICGHSKPGKPRGMLPTTSPPAFSNPTAQDTSVVMATAMSTFGKFAE